MVPIQHLDAKAETNLQNVVWLGEASIYCAVVLPFLLICSYLGPWTRTPCVPGGGSGSHGALPGAGDTAQEVPVRLAEERWRTRLQSCVWNHYQPSTLQPAGPLQREGERERA